MEVVGFDRYNKTATDVSAHVHEVRDKMGPLERSKSGRGKVVGELSVGQSARTMYKDRKFSRTVSQPRRVTVKIEIFFEHNIKTGTWHRKDCKRHEARREMISSSQ